MNKKMLMKSSVIGVLVSVLLSGCAIGHRDPIEAKATLNQAIHQQQQHSLDHLPEGVSQDLFGATSEMESVVNLPPALEKRFQVRANNVDVRAFFPSLLKNTEYNLIIHPKVVGRLTLDLRQVTLNDVLREIEFLYGYQIQRVGKMIRILPASLRTEVLPVDYLQLTREGRSLTTVSSGSMVNQESGDTVEAGGTRIQTESKSDFWAQLDETLSAMVGTGEGRSVVVSPQAGVITVRAFPDELREIKDFLGVAQRRLKRQVVLEAKILEVTLNDGYQQGIQWKNLTQSLGNTGITVGTTAMNAVLPGSQGLGGQTNITIKDGNFEGVLQFLQVQGDLNVLSSPRVTAANNQKAVIKVGGDQYFVTDIQGGDVTSDGGTSSPDITLTPFFSGISLDVTPQIDDRGGVLLHVHPTVVEVSTDHLSIQLGEQFGTYDLPLAKSAIRESDSVIYAQSGDVVVIGGLMKSSTHDQVSKIPLLGDIPVLGHAFRNTKKISQKTELVILLKPTVVTDQTWSQELQRSQRLLQDWFPESR